MDLPDEEPAGPTVWRPVDADAADWVAMKGQAAQAAIDDIQAQHDRRVALLGVWLARERIRHDRTVQWATDLLGRWIREQVAADTSKSPRRSRDMPSGVRVKLTSGRASVIVSDRDALVAWARVNEQGLLRQADPEPDKTALKALKVRGDGTLVTPDGLVVPGARVDTGPDTPKVEYGGAS